MALSLTPNRQRGAFSLVVAHVGISIFQMKVVGINKTQTIIFQNHRMLWVRRDLSTPKSIMYPLRSLTAKGRDQVKVLKALFSLTFNTSMNGASKIYCYPKPISNLFSFLNFIQIFLHLRATYCWEYFCTELGIFCPILKQLKRIRIFSDLREVPSKLQYNKNTDLFFAVFSPITHN